MKEIEVPSRFNGPPNMANGGYLGALVEESVGEPIELTLRSPAPLDTVMHLVRGEQSMRLMHGETLVAEATPRSIDLSAPIGPSFASAVEASKNYIGLREHPFPTCFVCGTDRHADGLCLAPGPVGDDLIAGPWIPGAEFDDGTGHVKRKILWAALDCPSGIVLMKEQFRPVVTGKMAARIEKPIAIGEKCVVIGWAKAHDGRKHQTGAAIFDQQGDLCGVSDLLWIDI